ncbi:MAG: hypothetical protein QG650_1166, partial [Patescibacteria group bacterium]|nr:hypothetical protein [Patescibacteria group bacterium]
AYALSGAFAYVDGDPVALTGGDIGQPPADSNYTAGKPDYVKLKLDPEKFRVSASGLPGKAIALALSPFGASEAAFDPASQMAAAFDSKSVAANGAPRNTGYFQVAGISPDTGAVSVAGNFPPPTPEESASGAVSGLLKNPNATGTDAGITAIADGEDLDVAPLAPDGNSASENSCASALPSCDGISCTLTYSPSSVNQAWTKDAASCGFACTGGHSGTDCMTAPSCPSGFVMIPGSSSVTVGGTSAPGGWCVAKYEMSPYDTAGWTQDAYLGWKYDSASKPDPKVVSKSGSYPITYVTRNEAETACSTQLADQVGMALPNGHLLSVALWKKIADDVAAQNVNWSGNAPGSGNMSRGHASGTPNSTLQGLASDAVANPAASNFYGRRTWALSSGSVIHDFAGNVWEWYYDLHAGSCSAWAEHTSGTFSYDGVSLETTTPTWNSARGVGQICSTSAMIPTTATYSAIFGGSWGDAAHAGIFASDWTTYSPSANRSIDIGFRCTVPAR